MAIKTEQVRGTRSEIDEQVKELNAKIDWIKDYQYMSVAEISYEVADEIAVTTESVQKSVVEQKNHTVYRYYGNTIKYIGNSGTVYNECQAKFFTKTDAKKKAEAMNKKVGGSVWGYKKSK